MAEVFISYVEEDGSIARQIADGLEESGYTVWYYERDSLPGHSYLEQILDVIDKAEAVIVILSPATLGSPQVNIEISEAHVAGKRFVPLLHDLTYATLTSRQRAWTMMFGTAVAAPIPEAGVAALMPRLVRGLQAIGVAPRPKAPSAAAAAAEPQDAISIGDDAPVVELNDLDGKPVKLADFAGRPTAVLFWDPDSPFCQRLLGELKAWEANPPADAPKLLVISTGDVQRNREIGLRSPVLLDDGFITGDAFGAKGTPMAVLVSADSKIASGLAVGGPQVLLLLRNHFQMPQARRRVQKGDKAPHVSLPDLDWNQVALDDIRKGRTVLLIWKPASPACQQVVGELKGWEATRSSDAPELVLISSGYPDPNREHGLASTILLDQWLSISEMFGATKVPTAVLIDADGTVASDLAVGGPEVMALLRS